MTTLHGSLLHGSCFAGLALVIAGCASAPGGGSTGNEASFDQARSVIEASCVHCHGSQRIAGMPSFASSRDLAALTGPGKLIVPGAPEQSRFFQVVAMSDSDIGAMPPTGHALTPREVGVLKAWIAGGAEVPAGNLVLKPHGESPRSR
jgi:mono/diheme cytochrome c family protein